MILRYMAVMAIIVCATAARADDQVVRVNYTVLPPYVFATKTGQPDGFAIDLIREIAELKSWKLEFTSVPNPGVAIRNLSDGRADIHPNLAPSRERLQLVLFSSPFDTSQISVFVNSELFAATSIEKLTDQKIGYVAGSAPARMLLQAYSNTVEYPSSAAMIKGLQTGEIVGIAYLDKALERLAHSDRSLQKLYPLTPPLLSVTHSMAISPSAAHLQFLVNDAMLELRETGRFQDLHDKWFPQTTPSISVATLLWGSGVLAALALIIIASLLIRSRGIRARYDALQEILDVLPASIQLWSQNGDTLYVETNEPYFGFKPIGKNETYREMLNRIADDPKMDLEHASKQEWIEFRIKKFEQDSEFFATLSDGRKVQVVSRKTRSDKVVIFRHDVTALRRKELDTLAQQQRLILDTATSGIIALDRSGKLILSNPSACRMLGVPNMVTPCDWPTEINFLDVETLAPVAAIESPIHRALNGAILQGEVNVMTRQDSETPRYVRISSSKVADPSTQMRVVIAFEDVTKQELGRQQAERSGRLDALGQLSGGIAHDFNNLLATIHYALELTATEKLSDKGARRMQTAIGAVSRGAELTNRLMAFASHQPSVSVAQNVNTVLKDLADLAGPLIEAKLILTVIPAAGDPWVYCPKGQLEASLLNLVLNSRDAIVASGKGSQIKIQAQITNDAYNRTGDLEFGYSPPDNNQDTPQNWVKISVSDDGPGMSEAVKKRAIDPFFTTKEALSGTGLGLSMVYGFIQQSNGILRLKTQLNEGTKMTLLLAQHHSLSKPAPPKTNGADRPQNLRILLVEDEPDLLSVMSDRIAEMGHRPIPAQSVKQALEIMDANTEFDLLLSDIVMPDETNGFDLAEIVRARFPDMPVIYMSGYFGSGKMKIGAVKAPILSKPCSQVDLQNAIKEVLAYQNSPSDQR